MIRALTVVCSLWLAGPALAQSCSDVMLPCGNNAIVGRTTLGQSRIPMILPSSGLMGNNGALTLTTALDQTYTSAYFYMPAGAIAVSSTAGFYYGTMSSTTAVTLFNNPYVSGTSTIPASPTAFATTGAGAYVQTTATNLTAYSLSLAGGTLGIYDEVQSHGLISYNNSAGQKTLTLQYSSYAYGTAGVTTTTNYSFQGGFANVGTVNKQYQTGTTALSLAAGGAAVPSYGAINSASAQNLTALLKLAVATDYVILQSFTTEKISTSNN